MTSLLEDNLREMRLEVDQLVKLFICLTSTDKATSMISSEPLWKIALSELEIHFNMGSLDYYDLYTIIKQASV